MGMFNPCNGKGEFAGSYFDVWLSKKLDMVFDFDMVLLWIFGSDLDEAMPSST